MSLLKSYVFPGLAVLTITGLTACFGLQPDRVPDPTAQGGRTSSEVYRGYLVYGHETRSFEACDSTESSWVIDDTDGELPTLYRQLTSTPYQRLFVELEGELRSGPGQGFAADYPNRLYVSGVRRAERESAGCDLDLSQLRFRAFGNEPFWSLSVERDTLRWSTPGQSRSYVAPTMTVIDGGYRYRAQADDGSAQTLELKLQARLCADSMADNRYSYRAEVVLEAVVYSGCALQGDLPPG